MPISNVTTSLLGQHLEFDIDGIDVGFLNAIRRVALSEIPNVAVSFDSYHPETSDVNVISNTSALHNEFTGHRISLLPLCFDSDEIESYDPIKYKFVIDETGPKLVTTGDIKVFDDVDNEYPASVREKIFPPDPITGTYIIITKLKTPDEKLHVEFAGRKGIAKMHTRWCPVNTCTYFNNLDVTEVTKARLAVDKTSDAAVNKFETLDKYRLFSKNEYDEPNSFHVIIESECRMTPSYIWQKAIDVVVAKLESIGNPEKIVVQPIDQDNHLYAIQIKNEDHTLGNLLQVSLYNDYVRAQDTLDFAGYFQPHPLESDIICKIRFFEAHDDVAGFMKEAVDKAIVKLRAIGPVTKAVKTKVVKTKK